ncbi:hypothetical protein K2V03_002136 [Listeria innocua]|nr:hypothetical protein [Listeria innocua]EIU0523726.1 hypothetical protein [Listeria innocua]
MTAAEKISLYIVENYGKNTYFYSNQLIQDLKYKYPLGTIRNALYVLKRRGYLESIAPRGQLYDRWSGKRPPQLWVHK